MSSRGRSPRPTGEPGQPGKGIGRTAGIGRKPGMRRAGPPRRHPQAGSRGQQPRLARQQPPRDDEASSVDVHNPDGIRLQKLLAAAGWGSRRACELLITQGRVEVDGHVVRELGVRIDPVTQPVRVDGMRVQVDVSRSYLAFNKPRGVVSSMNDERGRPCVSDFLTRGSTGLFHVGRLDADTDGLLLLTNDGELAHRVQHPSFGLAKTYLALIDGPLPRDLGRTLRAGVELDDGPVAVDSFRVVDSLPGKAMVEVVLHEGRKHVVRRLLAQVGHPVRSLTRTAVGSIRLGDLRSGKTRPLSSREVADLFELAGM